MQFLINEQKLIEKLRECYNHKAQPIPVYRSRLLKVIVQFVSSRCVFK